MGSPLLVIGRGSARARRSPFEPWFSGLRGFGPRTGGHHRRSATPGRARHRERPSAGRLEGAGRARRARPAPRRGVRGWAKRGGPADAGPIAPSAAPPPGPSVLRIRGLLNVSARRASAGLESGEAPAARARSSFPALRRARSRPRPRADPPALLCPRRLRSSFTGLARYVFIGSPLLGGGSGSSGVVSTPVDSKPTGEIAALALRRVGALPVEHRGLQTGDESTSHANELSVAVASAVTRSHLVAPIGSLITGNDSTVVTVTCQGRIPVTMKP